MLDYRDSSFNEVSLVAEVSNEDSSQEDSSQEDSSREDSCHED